MAGSGTPGPYRDPSGLPSDATAPRPGTASRNRPAAAGAGCATGSSLAGPPAHRVRAATTVAGGGDRGLPRDQPEHQHRGHRDLDPLVHRRAEPGLDPAHADPDHPQPRRIHVGPYLTFLFENRETIRYQIQEMLLAERIVKEADIVHEIETYN